MNYSFKRSAAAKALARHVGGRCSLKRRSVGFTLIELLVVIAVIGLLAAVILASLSDARKKAQYAQVVSDFQEIEKALNLVYNDRGCWPIEKTAGNCGISLADPTIEALITGTSGLGNYLKQAPVYPLPSDGKSYRYDNDGNVHNPITCNSGTAATSGVNIYVEGDLASFKALNTIVDKDPDPTTAKAKYCGKIRWNNDDLILYSLSNTQ